MSNSLNQRNKYSLWMQAIRPFSLTASIVPILIGAVLAASLNNGTANWYLMIPILLGGLLFQISGNLFSEYYDFKFNIDRPETYGSSRVLVDGLMKPTSIFWGAVLSLIPLLLIGFILVYFRGWEILLIGLIGILGSYVYTSFKYNALGDLHIFLSFGPLMMFGTFYALTGSLEFIGEIILFSIPISFLATAILHANNTRDIKHDTEAKIKTFAIIIGINSSKHYYNFLIIGAYFFVLILVFFNIATYWTLIVFVTIPLAIRNIKTIKAASVELPERIKMLDIMTAQLHMFFGILFMVGLVLGYKI